MKEDLLFATGENNELLKNHLFLPDTDDLFYIEKDSMLLLLSGKETKFSLPVKEYFSPVFLSDLQTERLYPLIFLKSHSWKEGRNTYFTRTNAIPYLNNMALSLLKDNGIDLSESSLSDLDALLFSLQSSIDYHGLSERLSLIPALSFYDIETLACNTAYQTIKTLGESDHDIKYDGLFKKVEVDVDHQFIENFFEIYEESLNILKESHSLSIGYSSPSIRDYFILNTISRIVRKSENLVIVTPDSDSKFKMRIFLKEHGLDAFCMDYSLYDPSALKKKDIVLKKSLLSDEQLSLYEKAKDTQKELASLYGIYHSKLSLTLVEEPLFTQLFSSSVTKDEYYKLDIEGYSDEDYHNDLGFCEKLDSFPTVISKPLTANPFYGLIYSSKKENYDKLKTNIEQVIQGIFDFSSLLKANGISKINGQEITCFKDFTDFGLDLDIIAQYSGFPLDMLESQVTEDPNFPLSQLKKLYQALSSTTLLADNLCDQSIYQQDISKLTENYKNSRFINKYLAKRKLISFLKIKKHPDVDTLVRILDSYIQSNKEINDILPEYKKRYGEGVSSMNGLAEIESDFRYIHKFNMRGKYNPAFKLDNPAIHQLLADDSKRQSLFKSYEIALTSYRRLNVLINHYIGYFLDDRKNYLSISFDEFISQLQFRNSGTYEEYSQYADFKSNLECTSILLQMTVRSLTQEETNLLKFKETYLLSVISLMYQKQCSSLPIILDEQKEAIDEYERLKPQLKGLNDLFQEDEMAKSVNEAITEPEYVDSFNSLIHRLSQKSFDIRMNLLSYQLYAKSYPIILMTSAECGSRPEAVFDQTMVISSSRFSSVALLSAMSLSQKAIFVNSVSESDNRLKGYPEKILSLESLYLNKLRENTLPPVIEDYLSKKVSEYGYELVTTSSLFPLGLKKKGDKDISIAILPDTFVNPIYYEKVFTVLKPFMKDYLNVILIPIILNQVIMEKESIDDLFGINSLKKTGNQ